MAVAGKGGSVVINVSDKIAEIANWTLDLGADNIDITSFDSGGWKKFLAGLKEWAGSFEGNYAPDDTDGQKKLIEAWTNGTSVALILKLSETVSFSGDAFVTPSIEVPVDDKASFSCDFQGTGALTVPV